ncbi:hypothetical protein IPH19_04190 [Candidatus Uhrbacteria bacterium]|nr:MAG: hypothetical protein IPH19_04190 [Candidatus Uhrbacteria bacterium]
MNVRHRTFSIAMLAISLALLGLGCRRPGTNINPANTQVIPTKTETATPFDPNAPRPVDQEGPSPEGILARQALKNLSVAKTYRTTMIIPTASGTVKASADVNRDQGILGKLEVPSAQGTLSSEIYIAGETVFFRQNTTTWSNISNTNEGRQFTTLFQNALAPDGTDVSRIVSDNTRTVETKEDATGCTLYTLNQVNAAGKRVPYKICLRNDLPSYLSLQTTAGVLTVTYTDINGPVVVQRPQ